MHDDSGRILLHNLCKTDGLTCITVVSKWLGREIYSWQRIQTSSFNEYIYVYGGSSLTFGSQIEAYFGKRSVCGHHSFLNESKSCHFYIANYFRHLWVISEFYWLGSCVGQFLPNPKNAQSRFRSFPLESVPAQVILVDLVFCSSSRAFRPHMRLLSTNDSRLAILKPFWK